eukprot:COSAG06_NODE_65558_length_256_cov_1.630573_1_plen_60_part_01
MLAGDAEQPAAGAGMPAEEPASTADGMPWEKYRVVLIAACIGNVLEWYDFAVYGGFANEF